MNKAALYTLSYGLYVVTSGRDGRFNGQIANTVFQVTSEPPTVAVSINRQNYTHEHITASRCFALSILDERCPLGFIGRFGFKCGRDLDKLDGVGVRRGATGIPIVTEHAVAFIEAEVIQQMDCGTHTLFLGRVVEGDLLDPAAEPMTYAYYHRVKGGKAPKTAPTYQEVPAAAPAAAARYLCPVCGYVYDPAQGDPGAGIPPGTPFAALPEAWVCPVCGAEKGLFRPEG